MKFTANHVRALDIPYFSQEPPSRQPILSDECFARRLEQVRGQLERHYLDALVIYGDREHYSNFKYFAGFEPRFEEGLLILHKGQDAVIALGNECYPMYSYARIPVRPILASFLSLPSQPVRGMTSGKEIFVEAGLKNRRVGVVGWKLLCSGFACPESRKLDIPAFLAEDLIDVAGEDRVFNATWLLIDPAEGLRICNSAEEIALLEYGAAWAAQGVRNVLEQLPFMKNEQELASLLDSRGMQQTCHPFLVAGENTKKGLISPSTNPTQLGDPLTVAMGLEGGLTCRTGCLVAEPDQLLPAQQGYVEDFAKPYFAAVASWYATIGIGVTGGELFDLVQSIIPAEEFGWILNPGHLTATEEWLSSPIKKGSNIPFKSGMVVQMDIIPSSRVYAGANAEDGVCLADAALRDVLKKDYPEVWERMQNRRSFITEQLGIPLQPEVLPMSDLVAQYYPLLLNREKKFGIAASAPQDRVPAEHR